MAGRRSTETAGNFAVAMLALVAALALVVGGGRPSFAGDRCASLPEVSLVAALDDNSRTTRTFDAERELTGFALYSYRNIAGDIINGQGPYLDALADPFRKTCERSSVLLDWFRRMLAASGSATDFSRRMGIALACVRTPCYPRVDRSGK
jgi:hypothetical protein